MLLLLAFAAGGLLAPLLYVAWQLDRAPTHTPEAVLAAGRPQGSLLLCLGDSITHGRIGADWVGRLRQEHGGALAVVNGGVNGELVWNVRQRAQTAMALRPDFTVLMIGTNDVMAADRPDRARGYERSNRLPQSPTLAWSIAELAALTAELKLACPRVALCTIPPLGDDPSAPAEALVREYNGRLGSVARAAGVELIDIHAALCALEPGGGRAYQGGIWAVVALVLRATAARYLFGRSWDAIARSAGWHLTVDGIHLSDRAGAVVAEAVNAWSERG